MEQVFMNRNAITAFGGRIKCGCWICRHDECENEVTHMLKGKEKIYLCAHCANVMHNRGYAVVEFVF